MLTRLTYDIDFTTNSMCANTQSDLAMGVFGKTLRLTKIAQGVRFCEQTHALQPAEMRSEPGAEGNVLAVFHTKLSTCLFHHFGNGRVVDVADAWEEVMFNLKIQATQEPT